MQYSSDELASAKGEPRPRIDPASAYLLGPTSEYDDVYLFDHKLDALYFVKSYFESQLSPDDLKAIEGQVSAIRKNLSDEDLFQISELLADNPSMEIYAEGYWEDFVISSHPYWEQWAEYLNEDDYASDIWDMEDEEGDDTDSALAVNGDLEDTGGNFLFSEPPDDPFHPEFVNAMMRIIPLA